MIIPFSWKSKICLDSFSLHREPKLLSLYTFNSLLRCLIVTFNLLFNVLMIIWSAPVQWFYFIEIITYTENCLKQWDLRFFLSLYYYKISLKKEPLGSAMLYPFEPRTTVPTRVKLQFCESWYSIDADSIKKTYLQCF